MSHIVKMYSSKADFSVAYQHKVCADFSKCLIPKSLPSASGRSWSDPACIWPADALRRGDAAKVSTLCGWWGSGMANLGIYGKLESPLCPFLHFIYLTDTFLWSNTLFWESRVSQSLQLLVKGLAQEPSGKTTLPTHWATQCPPPPIHHRCYYAKTWGKIKHIATESTANKCMFCSVWVEWLVHWKSDD